MELCPNCENQIVKDQIVCSVCGMILKDIKIFPNIFKRFLFGCLFLILIVIFVNLFGLLFIQL